MDSFQAFLKELFEINDLERESEQESLEEETLSLDYPAAQEYYSPEERAAQDRAAVEFFSKGNNTELTI